MRTVSHYIINNYSVLIRRQKNGDLVISSGAYPIDPKDRISCKWSQLSAIGEHHCLKDYLKYCFSGSQYEEVSATLCSAVKEDWKKNYDDRLNEWKI